MAVIRRSAWPFSVVWLPLMAHLAQQMVPLCLKSNLSAPPTPSAHPPTPLYGALMIFCATSEKDSEKPVNPNSRYL